MVSPDKISMPRFVKRQTMRFVTYQQKHLRIIISATFTTHFKTVIFVVMINDFSGHDEAVMRLISLSRSTPKLSETHYLSVRSELVKQGYTRRNHK